MRSRWLISCFVVLAPFVMSCAGDHPAEPTIGSVNFTPRLIVTVDDGGFDVARGDAANPAVTDDPPAAPEGTVIEIRNDGTRDHRVTAGTAIDTGIMQPGDSTTVVLTAEGDLELHDAESGATLTISVTPRTA